MKKKVSFILFFMAFAVISLFGFTAYADELPLVIDRDNTSVTLSKTVYTYDSNEKKPATEVVWTNENGEELTLVKDVDYTAAYNNNINAGTASVVINGIGDYTGEIEETFKINKYSISKQKNLSTKLDYSSATYSGTAKKPNVKITFTSSKKKITLKNNTDFKVSYSNNTKPGKATVKITGTGNYTGSYSKTFKILPAKVKGVKTSKRTTSSIVLNWSKQKDISGYQIAVYDSSKKGYKHLAYVSSKKTSYKVSKLKSGSTKKYKIRAYKTIDKKKCYGSYSSVITAVITPTKVTLVNVATNKNNLYIEWKKVNCSGYEIMYSTDSNFKKGVKTVKVTNGSKTSYTVKKINKKKTYYVKVRAFVKNNNKYYYGSRSSRLSSYYSNLYASYSSNYVNNPNRTNNLRIASKAISGKIIGVGKTFSFNAVVGPRTRAKGYKDAAVFTGSNSVEDSVGGGICQVASTMFNCALKANVKITERHQHSQRVSYVPLGRDAAIYGTAQNFKWTNNTKYPIKIVMTVKNGVITCKFYTCEKAKPPKVSLKVKQNGKKFTMTRSVKGKVNYTCKSNY